MIPEPRNQKEYRSDGTKQKTGDPEMRRKQGHSCTQKKQKEGYAI